MGIPVPSGVLGGFPSLCNPGSWVALGAFWKDSTGTVTSCVPLSHCVQSAKLLSRWLYLILFHGNSFSGCLGCPVHSGFGCRSKVGPSFIFLPICGLFILHAPLKVYLSWEWLQIPMVPRPSALWLWYPPHDLISPPTSDVVCAATGTLVVEGMI